MATAKKAAPDPKGKVRDYAAERARTKANKEKQAGGTSAQPKTEKGNKPPPVPAAPPTVDLGQCGHIDVQLSQIVSDPEQPRKFW